MTRGLYSLYVYCIDTHGIQHIYLILYIRTKTIKTWYTYTVHKYNEYTEETRNWENRKWVDFGFGCFVDCPDSSSFPFYHPPFTIITLFPFPFSQKKKEREESSYSAVYLMHLPKYKIFYSYKSRKPFPFSSTFLDFIFERESF